MPEKLAELRRQKGLSQIELAEAMSVSRQAVSMWESGATIPSIDNLILLSRLYGVPMEALLSPDSREEFQWGFSLSQEYAGLLGASAQPPVVALPDARCVYTVFSNPDSAFSPRFFGYALDFIRAQGLRLCGDVYGHLLISANESGPLAITPGTPQITGYFEAWLPVTDA